MIFVINLLFQKLFKEGEEGVCKNKFTMNCWYFFSAVLNMFSMENCRVLSEGGRKRTAATKR